jgi:nucleoside 2-deoxyribosyltransferase
MSYYSSKGEFEKAKEWRTKATIYLKKLGIDCFNPALRYDKNIYYDSKGVVNQNYIYLQKSDIMLLNLEYLEHSPGTLFEIFNFWSQHKPVISFGKTDIYYQPHVNAAITMNFPEIEKALEYINNLYFQIA